MRLPQISFTRLKFFLDWTANCAGENFDSVWEGTALWLAKDAILDELFQCSEAEISSTVREPDTDDLKR